MSEEHDLTFEKLEISKRLREAELQLARIVSHMESEQGTIQRMLQPIIDQTQTLRQMTIDHAHVIHGNGDRGLVLKVNNLENVTKLVMWVIGIFAVSSIGIFVATFWKVMAKG